MGASQIEATQLILLTRQFYFCCCCCYIFALLLWSGTKPACLQGRPVVFQQFSDIAVKVLHFVCHQIWKTQQWPQGWKRSVLISIPKKGNAKECSNYCTIALISHASKVMLKILQARFQQFVNCELPDVQAGFRKARGARDQIANIRWIIKKSKRVPEKHTLLLY